ncbi:MucR family transcriptional regulator [Caulobacter sp. S45]|uniref:MucR family transcriptional regulator n=1 Tax=Caulobacter sp. S45 TaxID=1641861 RepID=UPI00131E8584|nr:MucR family transcriptional regulator [Caulobacter sp. S45]
MTEDTSTDLITLTSEIVAAYVTNNAVATADLSSLIADTYKAMQSAGEPVTPSVPTLMPAVSIKKSVTPDHLISLEDGKSYKSLKRHLAIRGMTPDEYRAKWGLPKDYPMVAAAYSAQRSNLAKSLGFGREAAPAPAPAPTKAAKTPRAVKATKPPAKAKGKPA